MPRTGRVVCGSGHTCMLRKVPGLIEKMLTATPIKSPRTIAMNGSGTARSLVKDAHTMPMKTVPSKQMEKNKPQLSLYIRFGAVSQLTPSYPGKHWHVPSRWLQLPLPLPKDIRHNAKRGHSKPQSSGWTSAQQQTCNHWGNCACCSRLHRNLLRNGIFPTAFHTGHAQSSPGEHRHIRKNKLVQCKCAPLDRFSVCRSGPQSRCCSRSWCYHPCLDRRPCHCSVGGSKRCRKVL
jgi:hypothetical protein